MNFARTGDFPWASAIGSRVSIRIIEGDGFRDFLGLLVSPTSLRKKDGLIYHFDPSQVILWKLLPVRGTGIWLRNFRTGEDEEILARIGKRIHIIQCGRFDQPSEKSAALLLEKLSSNFQPIVARVEPASALKCHQAATRELDSRVDLHLSAVRDGLSAHIEEVGELNTAARGGNLIHLWYVVNN